MTRPLALLTFWFACLAMCGCSTQRTQPELITLTDVVPRRVEIGDRIEVLGVNLPSSDVRTARITFEGELRRPGMRTLTGQRIDVEGALVHSDKISTPYTEALQERLCGRGEEARHTTFVGTVTVTLPAAHKGVEVYGVVGSDEMPVMLDLAPPPLRDRTLRERRLEGKRVLSYLGLAIDRGAGASTGLAVDKVRSSGPADRAGVRAGDLIQSFGGMQVGGVSDLVPGTPSRETAVELIDPQGRARTVHVSMEAFRAHPVTDLVAPGVLLGLIAALILFFWAPSGRLLGWVERRVLARLTAPVPKDRVAPRSFFGWLFAAVRAVAKEDYAPREGGELLLRMAPYFVLLAVSATFALMPFGEVLVASELDLGVLFLLSVTSLTTIALLTGGFSAHGRWSVVVALRAVFHVISCEIPAAISILTVVLMAGSLSASEIIASQAGGGGQFLAEGSWPWFWYAFRSPPTFLMFCLFFATALAEGNRAAFEGVDGRDGRRGGLRATVFFFAEWANVFVMCGIASALFLGGWLLPGVSPAEQEANLALQCLGAALFLAKSWALIFVVIWVRWALPRVQTTHMMRLCWKWFVPLSILAFGLTQLWGLANVDVAAELTLSLVTLSTFVVLAGYMAFRLRASNSSVEPHANAFL